MSPAEIVRDARRSAGLTQAELADRLGMTQTAIAKLERADANPTYRTLERVLAAAGFRLQFLPAAWNDWGVDEGQLRGNLKLTPGKRIEEIQPLYDFGQEMRRAGERARGEHG
ncbi:MAG TPA: helix-turn-helix transcriptional regulator [Solirubrobacteraceae bacterium]|jgi:transcriptional regulator with XRE-family HTH domain|nr:helix-turn-helix transcriptional regulator [Solirubrobacteraceae bacterium]